MNKAPIKRLTPPSLRVFTLGLLVSLMLGSSLAHAVYKQREARWAAQVMETLLIGEPVWLTENQGHTFFSIYTPAATPRGGVLLLHGLGLHPDWPEVISPLRRKLPELGWSTLSLQMPLQPEGAPWTGAGPTLDESLRRIQAGVDFLRGKGIQRIVIIGHDFGATMGAAFLLGTQNSCVAGFVGLSMDAPTIVSVVNVLDPRLDTTVQMGKLKLPVLDIYGGVDAKRIVDLAPLRVQSARTGGNTDYQQVRDPDADHFFTNREKHYIDPLVRWLDEHWPAQ